MAAYTDAPEYAPTLLTGSPRLLRAPVNDPLLEVARPFFGGGAALHGCAWERGLWRHLFISGVAGSSQYDRLIRMARGGSALPHGLACAAREGIGFQGFRGRSWVTRAGNVHLTVHLAPGQAVERFETIFMALAALSVVEAIDTVAGLRGRAAIKWVNDVVMHGAKVAGVLAHTQTQGATVTSVILGIGLNVETTPVVPPTAFVPRAGSLRDFAPGGETPGAAEMLARVLDALERNYALLLAEGYRPLLERYRARSAVIGEIVQVSSDDPDEVPRVYAAGRVEGIGEGLELRLAGRPEPITKGRLIA